MTPLGRFASVLLGGVLGALLTLTIGFVPGAAAREANILSSDLIGDIKRTAVSEEAGETEVADHHRRRARRRVRRRYRRRARRDFRAGIYLGPDRFGLFLHERDFRRYRRLRRRDYYYRGRFGDHRYNRRFARAGHWYVAPRHRRFISVSCHPIYKRGFYDGFRVLIRARRCYDRFGRPFIVGGSRRIVEYY